MKNKKIRITYWIVLIIMTMGMLGSAVPSVLKLPYAVDYFCNVLKLPEYLLVFTGILKIAGLVVLFMPRLYKLKEWIFAGFTFDLMGAWYCNYIATSFAAAIPVLIYLGVLLTLYYLYTRMMMYNNLNISRIQ